MRRSGKQSVITILLVIVLTLALISLPLKFLVLDSSAAKSDKAADPPKAGAVAPTAEEFAQRKLAVEQVKQKVQLLLDNYEYQLEKEELDLQSMIADTE